MLCYSLSDFSKTRRCALASQLLMLESNNRCLLSLRIYTCFCHHIYIYIYECVHILRRYDIYIITHKNRFLADACWRQGSCSNSKSDVFLRLATPPLLLMHFPVLAMASLSIPWSPKLVRVGSGI